MSKRKIRRRKPRTARRRPKSRTWTGRLVVTQPPTGFAMDPETANAVLYAIAIHMEPRVASLHGFSVHGNGARMAFTITGDPSEFLNAIARDVAGYCNARFKSRGTRVEIEELSAIDTAEAQMQALVQIAVEATL